MVPSLREDVGVESRIDSAIWNLQKKVFVKHFDTIFEPSSNWLNQTFVVDESIVYHDHDHQVEARDDVPITSFDMCLGSVVQHTLFEKILISFDRFIRIGQISG